MGCKATKQTKYTLFHSKTIFHISIVDIISISMSCLPALQARTKEANRGILTSGLKSQANIFGTDMKQLQMANYEINGFVHLLYCLKSTIQKLEIYMHFKHILTLPFHTGFFLPEFNHFKYLACTWRFV